MEKTRRVAFHTLGCRLNQFETDSLASQFIKNGYRIVDFNDDADIYILNTCTVTGKSDRKSRNLSTRIKNKNAVTVVTGCFAELSSSGLIESGIDIVIGNSQKQNTFKIVDSFMRNISNTNFEDGVFDFPPGEPVFHTRGTVKIQDGCNNFCSFCIIPFARGRAISLDYNKILENVRISIQKGYREISLTGVNISRYSYDGVDFSSMLSKILAIDENFRVRISSIEPDLLSESFIDLFNHPRMCFHLHLCLQSGSDTILKKMKRQYTYSDYARFVNAIRKKNPLFNITTDIMVGFPGETDLDFQQSLNAVRELGFGHVHTFPYSRRRGTLADKMPDQIDETVKKERAGRIRTEAEKQKALYRARLAGQKDIVLIESANDTAYGLGKYYVPVRIKSGGCEFNSFYKVTLDGPDASGDLTAASYKKIIGIL